VDKHINEAPRTYVYGPVPSRRLGYSLGVDILSPKTCTLDCIYCQLGSTPAQTIQRQGFVPQDIVLAQIQDAIRANKPIDYITFSGSGEPTLNSEIGEMIHKIKTMTRIPVAVLTNATLLSQERVRRDLLEADLVVPSLDAVIQTLFIKVNRPHASLKISDIIQGLKDFRKEFSGQIWLEIMLVRGVNDSPEHIQKLKKVVAEVRPDKIQLNTVIRPPADDAAQPLTFDELSKIKTVLGERCEIIADFAKKEQPPHESSLERAILTTVRRRPVTLSDMAVFLGRHPDEILKILNRLLHEDRIRCVRHEGKIYYEPKGIH